MKMKRILATAMATATALSAMIIPTLTAAAVQPSLIDSTKTGTLTIHKYEMTDTSGLNDTNHKGTGEATDESKVGKATYPEDGAVEFAEVTFRATKVAEVNNGNYYKTDGVALPTPAQAKTMPAISTFTAMTDDDGVATFQNLPLGIYFVEEIDSPPQVMEKTADFVVSVPMTAEDGNHWNYDPVVFPKNETAYTEITIKKINRRTTHMNPDTTLQGAEFTLQRLHNYGKRTNNWDTIETGITTGADGTVSPTRPLAYKSTYRLVETKAPSKYILDHAQDTTVFYIDDHGRICDNTTHNVIDTKDPKMITISNTRPEVEKFIDRSKGAGTGLIKQTTVSHTSATDYDYYVIRVTTPDVAMGTMGKFIVTDTFGTKSLTRPIVSKVVESGTTNQLPADATGYTPTVDPTSPYTVKVEFSTADSTKVKRNTAYDIYIANFTHVLNSTTTNKADVEYTVETGTTKTDVIESDEVQIRTAAFQFKKLGKTAAATSPLANTKFKLYPTQNDAINGTNAITAQDGYTNEYTDTFTSNAEGMVWIKYLEYGDNIETSSRKYWLVETEAPNGFNLLKDPQEITVDKNSYTFDNTQYTVINPAKSILPRTGGYGILMYSIIGAGIAGIGAILILSTRKKKKNNG